MVKALVVMRKKVSEEDAEQSAHAHTVQSGKSADTCGGGARLSRAFKTPRSRSDRPFHACGTVNQNLTVQTVLLSALEYDKMFNKNPPEIQGSWYNYLDIHIYVSGIHIFGNSVTNL